MGHVGNDPFHLQELQQQREKMHAQMDLQYRRPINSSRKYWGFIISFWKKAIWKSLRFLIEPIVQGERVFNYSVFTTIGTLCDNTQRLQEYTQSALNRLAENEIRTLRLQQALEQAAVQQKEIIKSYATISEQHRLAGFLLDEIYQMKYTVPPAGIARTDPKTAALPIVFICDNNYAEPTRVAIVSAMCNRNTATRYQFYVVGMDLSEESIRLFENLGKNVQVIQRENTYAKYGFTHMYVSAAALLKFDLADILTGLDRVLYLDSDILILEDLRELFWTDLTDVYAAVVRDMAGTLGESHHKKMGHDDYFNSGVMLLNLKRMREHKIPQALLENKIHEKWHSFMDQDVFNDTFAQEVRFLPPKYNLMASNLKIGGFTADQFAGFYRLPVDEAEEIIEHPHILHMTNYIKPWKSYAADHFELYHKYKILETRQRDPSNDTNREH